MTAWQVAGFRSAIAALVLLALIPESRQNWTWKTFAVGIAYAATMVAFVTANKLTTATNAIFLQSTAPLYVLLLSPFLLAEKARRSDILVFAGIATGAALLLLGSSAASSNATNPVKGNIVALASGITWALTMMGLRWLARRDAGIGPATATVVVGNLIACLACLPFIFPVQNNGAADWAVVIYIGIFQVALAYVFLTRSIRHVPAFEAATLLMLEPVFNPLWTWLARGERPTALAALGGACILAAALAGTWWQTRAA